jgi:hypothetical protein
MMTLMAASSGNHSELEFSKLFEAPYVLSATGTRRYIRERQQHATSKDHVIAWLCEATEHLGLQIFRYYC